MKNIDSFANIQKKVKKTKYLYKIDLVFMKVDKIIKEEINKFIGSKCMLKEYKNPNDSEIVGACAEQLENLYEKIINAGMSKREITIKRLYEITKELRVLENEMRG